VSRCQEWFILPSRHQRLFSYPMRQYERPLPDCYLPIKWQRMLRMLTASLALTHVK
jgi:hypothetical protein